MESIGIVLKDIMGNSAVFIAGKEAVIVSAVSIVISVFIGILGLKLIRVWNAVIGFVAGALLGFAVTYLMGLEVDYVQKYVNSDWLTSVGDCGITADDYANQYQYNLDLGSDVDGNVRALFWQATPGCYAVRADLAEKYLGTTDPAAIGIPLLLQQKK